MSNFPSCPVCSLEDTYPDGDNYVCADCAHEWSMQVAAGASDEDERIVKDSTAMCWPMETPSS